MTLTRMCAGMWSGYIGQLPAPAPESAPQSPEAQRESAVTLIQEMERRRCAAGVRIQIRWGRGRRFTGRKPREISLPTAVATAGATMAINVACTWVQVRILPLSVPRLQFSGRQ